MAELVALIELGSNAARFVLARVKPSRGFRVLEQERVQTRLGAGRAGTLPRAAVEATVEAVDAFLRRARDGREARVVAVATSALREAPSRTRVLAAIRRRAGVDVEVLTGAQEARLAALAALDSLPLRRGLVLDLGGASVELARLRDREIVSTASLPLGAIRLTRRFLRHDPPAARELRALRLAVRETLAGQLPPAARREEMIGLGGTVRALASIHLRREGRGRRERHGLRLRQSDVTAIRERLEPVGERKRRKIRGLRRERADTMLAGTMVVEEAMLLGGYLRLVVCTQGVRDGVLLRETFHGGGAR